MARRLRRLRLGPSVGSALGGTLWVRRSAGPYGCSRADPRSCAVTAAEAHRADATPRIRPASVPARSVGWLTGASAASEQGWRRHPLCSLDHRSGSRDREWSRAERARPRSRRRTGSRRIRGPYARVPTGALFPFIAAGASPPKLPQRRIRTSQSRQRDEAVKSRERSGVSQLYTISAPADNRLLR
jgi:hypothetical protein